MACSTESSPQDIKSISWQLLVCIFVTLFIPGESWAAKSSVDAAGGTATPDSTTAATGGSTQSGSKNQTQPQAAGTSPPPAPNAGPIESQILAYEALTNRAKEVAGFMLHTIDPLPSPAQPATFVVLDANQLGLIPAFRSFALQATVLKSQLCNALSLPTGTPAAAVPHKGPKKESVEAVAGTVSPIVAALSATVALFKETRTITASSVTLPDEALVAAVGAQLSDVPNVQLYYPAEVPIGVDSAFDTPPPSAPPAVECGRDDHADSVFRRLITIQYLRLQTGVVESTLNAKTPAERKPVQNTLDILNAVNKTYDATLTAWSAVDGTTNKAGWEGILRGEKLAQKLNAHAYVVELKIQSSGGETTSLDGFFFLAGASYYYSGGTIVTAIVFDPASGQIKASRNFWEMSGDVKRTSFKSRKDQDTTSLKNCLADAFAAGVPSPQTAARNCVGMN